MRRSLRKSLQLLPVPISQALLSSETALLVHRSVHQRETSVIRLASCNSRAEAKAGESEDSIRSQSTLYVSLPLDVTREATPLSGASESESSSSVSALAPQYTDLTDEERGYIADLTCHCTVVVFVHRAPGDVASTRNIPIEGLLATS